MKNTIKLILVFVACIFALVSCQEYFDVTPDDRLDENMHFNNANDIQNGAIGIFSLMQEVAGQNLILNELVSDLLQPTSNSAEDFLEINSYSADVSNPYVDPKKYFKLIINCNDYIARAAEYREEDQSMPEDEFNAFLGSVRVIRSWAFFSLGKLYGSVPYFTDPVESYEKLNDENLYVVYNLDELIDTQLAEIDSIQAQLGSKSINWPPILGGSDYSWNRLSIDITCYESELLLWDGNYEEAASLLLSLINDDSNNHKYKVTTKFEKGNWEKLFTNSINSNSDEFFTAVPYDKNRNQKNELQYLFSNIAPNIYQLRPTDIAINLFEEQNDGEGDRYRGKGISYGYESGEPVVEKYTLGRNSFDQDANIIIYRAADIHLMLCEALNRLGEHEKVLAILNDGIKEYWDGEQFLPPFDTEEYKVIDHLRYNEGIRGRVDLPSRLLEADEFGEIDTLTQIENFVVEESALELAFEGKRWSYLMRVTKRRNDPSFLADKIAISFPEGEQDAIRSKLMDQNNWFLPSDWWNK